MPTEYKQSIISSGKKKYRCNHSTKKVLSASSS